VRPNELSPVPGSVRKRKRIGRGNASGHGTYATRGLKGQQSRSGRDLRIGFEGGQNPLVRSLSRKRGFNNRFRVEYETVNVGVLAKLPAGSVTSESLRSAGIVKSARKPVKILGDGEISVALQVEVEKISAGARAKIEAAGGTATMLVPPKQKKLRYAGTAPASRDDDDDGEAPASAPAAEASAETPAEAEPEAPAETSAETPAAEAAPEAKPARRTRAPRARAEPAAESESSQESGESEPEA
jgi:large subunit ribosomal protein L15